MVLDRETAREAAEKRWGVRHRCPECGKEHRGKVAARVNEAGRLGKEPDFGVGGAADGPRLTADRPDITAGSAVETMDLTFEFDADRTVGAILYLASKKIPDLTKWKLCKLLYLADRIHLARCGRPITGDVYYALPHGPIPSYTLDALNDDDELAMELVDLVRKDDSQKYPTYSPAPGAEAKCQERLSTSDIRALDEVVEKYGHMVFPELSRVVDKTVAYRKAWAKRKGARSLMRFEDFFEDVPGARPDLLEELLDNRQIHHALQFDQ